MKSKSIFYKIAYRLHKISFYYCSIKFYAEDKNNYINVKLVDFFIYCYNFFIGIWKKFPIFLLNSDFYEYLEIPITTKCTLKCKNCSNIIPYYEKPCHMDLEKMLESIDIFLDCIKNIVYIRLLGGEPFLNPDLLKIINKLLESDKIQRVEIVTNGTIVPRSKKLISVLQNKKVIVAISDYRIVNNEKLVNFLRKNNIKYKINTAKYWMDYGNVKYRGKNSEELKKQFRKCNSICKSLINGQIHLCPRSAHGTDLKFIENNSSDYVDLLNKKIDIDEKRANLRALLKKEYIEACNYCDYGTDKCKKIPVAIQKEK